MKLLLVEDEARAAKYIREGLVEHGFVVDAVRTGEAGLRAIRFSSFDLVILDVMLPGIDGWSVLSAMRSAEIWTPVLFLTARDAVEDRVRGFELGADDYLVKPFAFSELLARVRSILRRPPARRLEKLTIADLEIDLVKHRARRGGVALNLTPKEFTLLSFLAARQSEVLSRTIITEQVWGLNFDSGSNVVDVHIRRLRAKVDDPFSVRLIRTVRGVGYVLQGPE